MIKRIKVEFTRTLHLPRFTMKKGETWEVRVDRLESQGFSLGGGFVCNEDFGVVF
tara:strand:- start:268 stop:432 length:165 start_codon:yes stop_codon:yes gene_type:complete